MIATMSKNQTPKSEQAEAKGNPIADALLLDGATVLTAPSREELFAKFNEIKASVKDVPLATGAVGRSRDDGTYSLQVNIVKL
jgi:hypothetical protein